MKRFVSMLLCIALLLGLLPMAHAEEGEYNEKDMAAYAACVNSLAVEYGVPTILWDCSVHVNRKELRVNYPSYVDAIMGCYPDHAAGNGGDNAVFEEETALAAAANFGPGWNLGNTLDSTSYNLNDANAVRWAGSSSGERRMPRAIFCRKPGKRPGASPS